MVLNGQVAVLDIGSNAVRLVIYDGLNRTPVKIHNERIVCNLGADLSKTNRLSEESFNKALACVGRFSRLLAAMNIGNIKAVATAAVRDAENGHEFIDKIKHDFNLDVDIIDGNDEARLSALGVMSNGMGSSGIIGDYGGGSLELIVVENNEVKHKVSLPIGSHRLIAEEGTDNILKKINKELDSADFLARYQGLDFYALGGSWRSMAKAHIHMVDYPIKTIDHYCIEGNKAVDFVKLLSTQTPQSMEKMMGMPKKRVRDISVASLAMLELFKRIKPSAVFFSGTGLREGLIFQQLPKEQMKEDILLSSCIKFVACNSRFSDLSVFETLYKWIEPLVAGHDEKYLHYLKAACYLSDISLYEHEEYQADHAFERLLVMPFYGATHECRAFLSLAQFVRYKGYLRKGNRSSKNKNDHLIGVQSLLPNDAVDLAIVAGLAMHMAYMISGGALMLLQYSRFIVGEGVLRFQIRPDNTVVDKASMQEALQKIADAAGLKLQN